MQTRRIGFACGLGALVGGAIALDLTRWTGIGLLWIVGVLLGGLVGYLAYDFRRVGSAIGQAYQEMSGWRPDWKNVGMGLFNAVTFLAFTANILALGVICLLSGLGFVSDLFRETSPHFDWSLLVLSSLCLVGLLVFSNRVLGGPTPGPPDLKVAWKAIALFNPVILPLTALIWSIPRIPAAFLFTFQAASEFAQEIWRLLKMCWPLVKRVFVLIHSDERKLCFTDAMLGAMIGFFLGSAVLGGIAGALLGVVNYELVSIRLLHLPRRA